MLQGHISFAEGAVSLMRPGTRLIPSAVIYLPIQIVVDLG